MQTNGQPIVEEKKNFYDWHASLQKLVNSMLHGTAGLQNFSTVLDDMAGNSSMSAVMEKYGNSMRSARDTKTLKASAGKATLGAVVGSTIKSHKFYGN